MRRPKGIEGHEGCRSEPPRVAEQQPPEDLAIFLTEHRVARAEPKAPPPRVVDREVGPHGPALARDHLPVIDLMVRAASLRVADEEVVQVVLAPGEDLAVAATASVSEERSERTDGPLERRLVEGRLDPRLSAGELTERAHGLHREAGERLVEQLRVLYQHAGGALDVQHPAREAVSVSCRRLDQLFVRDLAGQLVEVAELANQCVG